MIWNNGILQEGTLFPYPKSDDKSLIYEVIRVIDGSPVFLPEHLERFWNAWNVKGNDLAFTESEITKGFFDVIKENELIEGNLRLQAGIGSGNTKIGIIPHHYPKPEDYQKGVVVDLVNMQRVDPNIKTWNESVRKLSDEYIRNNEVFEVILTSEDGFLREGSRSNIFGFQKGVLKTPPVKDVLPGITRQKIIEIAAGHNIPFIEEPIHKEDIYSYQSFFLTGTSPGILPIRSIDSIQFNCKSNTCDKIRKSYDKEIQKSIHESENIQLR